jgi:hypothetical protein
MNYSSNELMPKSSRLNKSNEKPLANAEDNELKTNSVASNFIRNHSKQ